MKLWGVAMARDEADIIEAFVRHNLSVLDGLSIIDHGSTDGTGEILASLAKEGLKLTVGHDPSVEFRQSATITQLVRQVFATTDSDYVFLLDADEFLKVPSRARLDTSLAELPIGSHAVHAWRNYVPDFARGLEGIELLQSSRRTTHQAPVSPKAIVSRHFEYSRTLIAEGNHAVVRAIGAEADPPVRHVRLSAEDCVVAHVPVRSAQQFAAKVAVGWLACLMQPGRAQGLSSHWRESYANLRAGVPLSPALLTMIAANYGVPINDWFPSASIQLVDDPFLADIRLPHHEARRTNALALILRFGERLAERVAASAENARPGMSA